MKTTILIALTFVHLSCCAQQLRKDAKYWFPEKYVEASLKGDTSNIDNLLIPVNGFITSGNDILIQTYASEPNPIRYEKINARKRRLKNVYYFINLQYFPPDSVNLYKRSEFVVSEESDRLLLEIKSEGRLRKIYYVSSAGDYKFTNLYNDQKYLQQKAAQK
ncbi:hypothetical protein [Dawidia soli]|uniref:Uncharacterized protein n=1 Tax=Dawidia soli TaxID=2782352 RepID=A0AAP2DHF0_9BACT|nr:hypothetical protein [Dawidia soli]MBT1689427.1 hypothetical protein [Dawidia soli]